MTQNFSVGQVDFTASLSYGPSFSSTPGSVRTVMVTSIQNGRGVCLPTTQPTMKPRTSRRTGPHLEWKTLVGKVRLPKGTFL